MRLPLRPPRALRRSATSLGLASLCEISCFHLLTGREYTRAVLFTKRPVCLRITRAFPQSMQLTDLVPYLLVFPEVTIELQIDCENVHSRSPRMPRSRSLIW